MLVITGVFENERFIPDKPVSIPQKKKVVVTIEEAGVTGTPVSAKKNFPPLTMAQIEEWAQTPEIQALVGVLKGRGLPENIKISDIRNERLAEKYKA
ncbi:MAG: DUF104 domain-containing protein [Treponema sp.]|nr:DUF104 domain-containing protein [Treponema sp.]MCL2139125.1 DUF104 domain-containing protein [Treponema sp.]